MIEILEQYLPDTNGLALVGKVIRRSSIEIERVDSAYREKGLLRCNVTHPLFTTIGGTRSQHEMLKNGRVGSLSPGSRVFYALINYH